MDLGEFRTAVGPLKHALKGWPTHPANPQAWRALVQAALGCWPEGGRLGRALALAGGAQREARCRCWILARGGGRTCFGDRSCPAGVQTLHRVPEY